MKYTDIGVRIRKRRKELDISAHELANRLHMSKATVHRYESGEIKNIKLPVIETIARELRCNPAWLVGKSNRKDAASDAYGNERYNDIVQLFDDIIQYIDYTDNIQCCSRRLDREDKTGIIVGLNTIKNMTLSKYQN